MATNGSPGPSRHHPSNLSITNNPPPSTGPPPQYSYPYPYPSTPSPSISPYPHHLDPDEFATAKAEFLARSTASSSIRAANPHLNFTGSPSRSPSKTRNLEAVNGSPRRSPRRPSGPPPGVLPPVPSFASLTMGFRRSSTQVFSGMDLGKGMTIMQGKGIGDPDNYRALPRDGSPGRTPRVRRRVSSTASFGSRGLGQAGRKESGELVMTPPPTVVRRTRTGSSAGRKGSGADLDKDLPAVPGSLDHHGERERRRERNVSVTASVVAGGNLQSQIGGREQQQQKERMRGQGRVVRRQSSTAAMSGSPQLVMTTMATQPVASQASSERQNNLRDKPHLWMPPEMFPSEDLSPVDANALPVVPPLRTSSLLPPPELQVAVPIGTLTTIPGPVSTMTTTTMDSPNANAIAGQKRGSRRRQLSLSQVIASAKAKNDQHLHSVALRSPPPPPQSTMGKQEVPELPQGHRHLRRLSAAFAISPVSAMLESVKGWTAHSSVHFGQQQQQLHSLQLQLQQQPPSLATTQSNPFPDLGLANHLTPTSPVPPIPINLHRRRISVDPAALQRQSQLVRVVGTGSGVKNRKRSSSATSVAGPTQQTLPTLARIGGNNFVGSSLGIGGDILQQGPEYITGPTGTATGRQASVVGDGDVTTTATASTENFSDEKKKEETKKKEVAGDSSSAQIAFAPRSSTTETYIREEGRNNTSSRSSSTTVKNEVHDRPSQNQKNAPLQAVGSKGSSELNSLGSSYAAAPTPFADESSNRNKVKATGRRRRSRILVHGTLETKRQTSASGPEKEQDSSSSVSSSRTAAATTSFVSAAAQRPPVAPTTTTSSVTTTSTSTVTAAPPSSSTHIPLHDKSPHRGTDPNTTTQSVASAAFSSFSSFPPPTTHAASSISPSSTVNNPLTLNVNTLDNTSLTRHSTAHPLTSDTPVSFSSLASAPGRTPAPRENTAAATTAVSSLSSPSATVVAAPLLSSSSTITPTPTPTITTDNQDNCHDPTDSSRDTDNLLPPSFAGPSTSSFSPSSPPSASTSTTTSSTEPLHVADNKNNNSNNNSAASSESRLRPTPSQTLKPSQATTTASSPSLSTTAVAGTSPQLSLSTSLGDRPTKPATASTTGSLIDPSTKVSSFPSSTTLATTTTTTLNSSTYPSSALFPDTAAVFAVTAAATRHHNLTASVAPSALPTQPPPRPPNTTVTAAGPTVTATAGVSARTNMYRGPQHGYDCYSNATGPHSSLRIDTHHAAAVLNDHHHPHTLSATTPDTAILMPSGYDHFHHGSSSSSHDPHGTIRSNGRQRGPQTSAADALSSQFQHGYPPQAVNGSGSLHSGPSQTQMPPGQTSRSRKLSQKEMLSRALAKANTAVELDNVQNFEGARLAYIEASELLNQVILRVGPDDVRRRLEEIRDRYTSRIEELDGMELGFNDDEKELPARPERDSSDFMPPSMNGSSTMYDDDEDDDEDTTMMMTPSTTATSSFGSNGPLSSRSNSNSQQMLAIPERPYRAGPLHSAFSTSPSGSYMQHQHQQQQRRPSEEQYMPHPLSPYRTGHSPSQGHSPNYHGSSNLTPHSAHDPGMGLGYGAAQSVSRQQSGNSLHARAMSQDSWLDHAGSGESTVSSLHSRASSMHHPSRSSIHARSMSRNTDFEFDAALDAAVEAAYDDPYEPVTTPMMNRQRLSAVGSSSSQMEDPVVAAMRKVELVKERVRQTQMEATRLEQERQHQRELQLREEAEQRYHELTEDLDLLETPGVNGGDFFDDHNSSDEEEPMGYKIKDVGVGQANSSADLSPTWQPQDGGLNARTWFNAGTSAPPSATFPNSSLEQGSNLTSAPHAQAEPAALPPDMNLPTLPNTKTRSRNTSEASQTVRNRRLSGQNPKQLMIETTSIRQTPSEQQIAEVPTPDTSATAQAVPQGQSQTAAQTAQADDEIPPEVVDNVMEMIAKHPPASAPPESAPPIPMGMAINMMHSTPPTTMNEFDDIPEDSYSPMSSRPLRKNYSSTSLRSTRTRNMSVSNIEDISDMSPGTPASTYRGGSGYPSVPTPLSAAFADPMKQESTEAMYFNDTNLNKISSNAAGGFAPRSHGATIDPHNPIPLEPCPNDFLLRPFWLMRCLYQTLCHPRGGFVSNKLFVPRDVWKVKGVKLKNLDDKIATCEQLTAALEKLSRVDTNDADSVLEEIQSFELVLEQLTPTLARKLGSDVGVQAPGILFRESSTADAEPAAPVPRSTSVSNKAGSSFSWRRLRNKTSQAGLAGQYSTNSSGGGSGLRTSGDGSGSSMPSRRDSPPGEILPFTMNPISRPVRRDVKSVKFSGPQAAYMEALAKLFDAAQMVDQIARQVEDPGLKHADKTQVGLELCTRHAAEFFAFYIVRFVMADMTNLLDKFVKRGTEWVVT